MSKYLLIYFRNLRKEQTKILNIFSIGLTLTFAFLILFFIEDELSYDKWNANKDNIYRIASLEKWPAKEFNKATSIFRTGPVLKNEFPEIKSFVRFLKIRNSKVVIDDKEFNEEKFFFTDSTIFEIFPYKLIEGSKKEALLNPGSIVISKELSEKYFNESNPLGKTISVNGTNYTITGITDNTSKSHLEFNALLSMQPFTESHHLQESDLKINGKINWEGASVYTYLLTLDKVNIEKLQSKLLSYYNKFSSEEKGYSYNIMLQPLSGIHFSDEQLEDDMPIMNIKYIYIFAILLVIILIFSTLNYINLVVGNSLKNVKFIGLNKIFGMRKKQIFSYFISDSLLNAVIAILLSFIILLFILPQYNDYFNKNLTLNILTNKLVRQNVLLLLALTGILPGLLLAIIFIPVNPFDILKNKFVKRNIFIRKVFVFLEISLLVVVVFGTIVVNFQLYKLKNTNLGFNENDIALIQIKNRDLIEKSTIFKDAIKNHNNVIEVASSDASVGNDYWIASFQTEIEGKLEYFDLKRIVVDENFSNLYELEFTVGRNFDKEIRTDVNNCIINEAALKKLNLSPDPINNRIRLSGKDDGVIIGVVKDFYFGSKHNEIEPLFICLSEEGGYTPVISVKIKSNAIHSTLQNLNEEWNNFSSREAFSYSFAEDKISGFYANEERLNVVFKLGTVLSFLIVSFGLFCFVIFIKEQKIKEIGIRKVNGASAQRIVISILQKEFLIPGFFALIFTLPISHFIIKGFLQNMVVEITISWWIYVLTVFIILLTLYSTTFYQLYKAANKNPVEALTCE
jgi:putative ABC transport system permease protein